jgi:hypothetical protein
MTWESPRQSVDDITARLNPAATTMIESYLYQPQYKLALSLSRFLIRPAADTTLFSSSFEDRFLSLFTCDGETARSCLLHRSAVVNGIHYRAIEIGVNEGHRSFDGVWTDRKSIWFLFGHIGQKWEQGWETGADDDNVVLDAGLERLVDDV